MLQQLQTEQHLRPRIARTGGAVEVLLAERFVAWRADAVQVLPSGRARRIDVAEIGGLAIPRQRPRLVSDGAVASEIHRADHRADHRGGLRVAAFCSSQRETECGGVIARHAVAAIHERSEIERRDREPLRGRFLVPLPRLDDVARLALAMLQHRAQIVLRSGEARVGRTAHPANRRVEIDRTAAPVAIRHRERELRDGVAFERGLAVPRTRGRIETERELSVSVAAGRAAYRISADCEGNLMMRRRPRRGLWLRPAAPFAQTTQTRVKWRALRASYNGYYPSFPSWRRGFDSHRPLHIQLISSGNPVREPPHRRRLFRPGGGNRAFR